MKKSFDAVAFMRRRREELTKEFEGIPVEGQLRIMRERVKERWPKLASRLNESGMTRGRGRPKTGG